MLHSTAPRPDHAHAIAKSYSLLIASISASRPGPEMPKNDSASRLHWMKSNGNTTTTPVRIGIKAHFAEHGGTTQCSKHPWRGPTGRSRDGPLRETACGTGGFAPTPPITRRSSAGQMNFQACTPVSCFGYRHRVQHLSDRELTTDDVKRAPIWTSLPRTAPLEVR